MKSKLKADNEWWEGPSPGADFSADVSFGVKNGSVGASKLCLRYPTKQTSTRDCDVRSVAQGCRCTRSHFTYACGRIAEELCSLPACVRKSGDGLAMSVAEYASYDAVGLAELVRKREV